MLYKINIEIINLILFINIINYIINKMLKTITIIPTQFKYGETYGDFYKMCADPKYSNAICLFNDNHEQWLLADPKSQSFNDHINHSPGSGNAMCRPFQINGDSIGIPTGPYTSLNQVVKLADGTNVTVKTIIDMAYKRIIDLFIKLPHKNTLYYSVNNLNSKIIGLGIFYNIVGDDVTNYITESIHNIPNHFL